jgi:putative ABC transport system permease protein
MFRNFISIAFRILLRHRVYSLINIVGLAVGLTSAILILLYVQDELSYDRGHENYERIFRLGLHATNQGNEFILPLSCVPLAPALVRDYPEVAAATRFFSFVGESTVKYGENSFLESRFFYADPDFFRVFTKGLLKGDPASVLARANTVVISDEMARKYFGDEDPVGKIIEVGVESMTEPFSVKEFEVTGVVEKYPVNSHLKFDFLGSFETLGLIHSTDWMSYLVYTYLLLEEGQSPGALEDKLPGMVRKYVGPQWEQQLHVTMEETFRRGNKYGYFIQPVRDIHLGQDTGYELEPGGNTAYLRLFSLIAAFLIIIASINFINLTTAQSSTRAREVGLRKVAGSTRPRLIIQFLTESILLSFFALVCAIILVGFVLPYFNNLSGKELSLDLLDNRILLPSLLVLGLVVGLLSGSYPSFLLSSYQPVITIRGEGGTGLRSRHLRGALVIFQFSVAIMLLSSTLIVSRQMNFIQDKDLGYNKENLLVISRIEALQDQKSAFRAEISKFPGISGTGLSNSLPHMILGNSLFRPEGVTARSTHALNHWLVGFDLQKTLDLEMVEGRWFSREFQLDSTGIVLNEAAVKAMGITDPIGKKISVISESVGGEFSLYTIGVIKDFHYESVHSMILPLAITYLPPRYSNYLVVRIQGEDMRKTVSLINRKWKEFVPDQPFEYFFLEDELATAYSDDTRTGTIFTLFTILAILISLLGLTGLASYTAVRRTKEIGIRKVLGADEASIVRIFTREVLLYIGISTLMAWPAAYLFMKNWLQNFAFRVDPGILSFFVAAVTALVVALLVVGLRAYIAARANPADSLRHE